MNEETNRNYENVVNKINSEHIIKGKIPTIMQNKKIKPIVTNIRINPKIKSLAEICSTNENIKKEKWVENLILREAKQKHNITLPEFEQRIVSNDN